MLTKNLRTFIAKEDIPEKTIVAFADGEDMIEVANGKDAKIAGVSDLGAKANDSCDVYVDGFAWVKTGDSVDAGDFISADENGKAVVIEGKGRVLGLAFTGIQGEGEIFTQICKSFVTVDATEETTPSATAEPTTESTPSATTDPTPDPTT